MRPRNPLRLIGKLLNWSDPPPKLRVVEDVENVGYFMSRDSIPRQVQEEWLREIESL